MIPLRYHSWRHGRAVRYPPEAALSVEVSYETVNSTVSSPHSAIGLISGLTISQPFNSQSDEQQHRLGNEMVSRLPGAIHERELNVLRPGALREAEQIRSVGGWAAKSHSMCLTRRGAMGKSSPTGLQMTVYGVASLR